MQSRIHKCFACFDFAANTFAEAPLRAQRDKRCVGRVAIVLLQWSLDGPQLFGVHDALSS
jgi:hypothetical protein